MSRQREVGRIKAALLKKGYPLDAGLAAGLYQRLKKLPPTNWLDTAIRGTIWPFVLTTLVVVGVGWGMNQYLPEAQSLGDVLAAIRSTG